MNVTMEPVDESVEDPLAEIESVYPELIDFIGGVFQSMERTMVDGHEALHGVFTLDTENAQITQHQYMISTSPLQTVTFVTDNSERDAPTLDQIMSTYRIIE